ncbi:thermonuclease family protein [Salinarimonas soli]|uniref:TNase-like domain-containing protein n=1 Tax=Salinarimonas soli TaxID=1638099 RepID=A0A5B2VCX5_9HYPH|nr:hypothetical protein [Salinarimonas soli]KAA2236911.1 hypothetical protein F0L46_13050 [Salinarimonas soli]
MPSRPDPTPDRAGRLRHPPAPGPRALPWDGQPIGYDRLGRRLAAAWRGWDRAAGRIVGARHGGTAALAVAAIAGLAVLLAFLGRTALSSLAPSIEAPSDVPAPAEPPRPKAQEALVPAPAGAAPESYFELQAPFELVDAVTLRTPLMTVRLKGVTGPDGKAVCSDDWGRRWACGLRGRAALNNATRTGLLRCSADKADVTEVEARCATPEGDLAARLVSEGWARPTEEGRFQAEAEEARQERRGLWNGNWSILP